MTLVVLDPQAGGLVTVATSSPLPAASDNVVIEAMRMNAEIAKAVVDRFPQMLEASAVLLRAADGAGLPARPGMVIETDDDDDEDDDDDRDGGEKRGGGFDIGAFLMQVAPVLVSLTGGKLKLPDLLSWTKAAEKGAATRKVAGAPAPTAGAHAPATAPAVEPSAEQQLRSDPAMGLHFVTIMNTLTPTEAELARTMAQELSAQDRTTWFNSLKTLSVADAVANVRAELERLNKNGGAS